MPACVCTPHSAVWITVHPTIRMGTLLMVLPTIRNSQGLPGPGCVPGCAQLLYRNEVSVPTASQEVMFAM